MMSMENVPDVISSMRGINSGMETKLDLQRLKGAMEKRGLKRRTLSQAAEVDESYMSKLLKGNIRSPGTDIMRRIAEELEVSVDWLFGRAGSGVAAGGTVDAVLFERCTNIAMGMVMGCGRKDMIGDRNKYARYVMEVYNAAARRVGASELDESFMMEIKELLDTIP